MLFAYSGLFLTLCSMQFRPPFSRPILTPMTGSLKRQKFIPSVLRCSFCTDWAAAVAATAPNGLCSGKSRLPYTSKVHMALLIPRC